MPFLNHTLELMQSIYKLAMPNKKGFKVRTNEQRNPDQTARMQSGLGTRRSLAHNSYIVESTDENEKIWRIHADSQVNLGFHFMLLVWFLPYRAY